MCVKGKGSTSVGQRVRHGVYSIARATSAVTSRGVVHRNLVFLDLAFTLEPRPREASTVHHDLGRRGTPQPSFAGLARHGHLSLRRHLAVRRV